MSAQTIYTKLVQAGMSPVGACAMMGNMWAESGGKSNNVQDGYGYTDEGYTAKVDAGQLNFIDSIGYGLCQWTYGPRKLKLLQFARSRGVSVGDEDMQVLSRGTGAKCIQLTSDQEGSCLYNRQNEHRKCE